MKKQINNRFLTLALFAMVIGTLAGLSVKSSIAGLPGNNDAKEISKDSFASLDESSALKCGGSEKADKTKTDKKTEPKESKCGAGKCGDGKETVKSESNKKVETKGKCGDGKCGGSEKVDKTKTGKKIESKENQSAKTKTSEKKATETKSKCGTGKCGS